MIDSRESAPRLPWHGPNGDEVRADPDVIRQHGNALVTRIGPYLENAAAAVENEPAEEFGEVGARAAAAYAAGKEFLVDDLRSKIGMLRRFRDELNLAAQTWDRASDASTIREE